MSKIEALGSQVVADFTNRIRISRRLRFFGLYRQMTKGNAGVHVQGDDEPERITLRMD
jgi:hypothetical protein